MNNIDVNKLDMQSKDIVNDNVDKIFKLFPNCISEGKIDFDMLKQELSKDIIVEGKEKYQLTWAGKRKSIVDANTPTEKTLRPVKEKSADFDNTKNIYIEGDNLEVLKILQESYLNKIKCIYIDPPYNTGNDFIYNDNFTKNVKNELEESGQIDEYNNRLITNNDSNGKFHSAWIAMMYPRLKLARNILSKDGVVFISIDENELFNLKKICDEIFGENNYISTLTVENNPKGRKNSKYVSVSCEYCLIYAKDCENSYFIENIPKDASEMKEDENGNFIHNSGKRVIVGENNFNKFITNQNSDKHYSVYYNKEKNDLILLKEELVSEIKSNLIHQGYNRYYSYRDGKFVENTYSINKFKELFANNELDFKEDKIYEKNMSTTIRIKNLLTNKKYKGIVNNEIVDVNLDYKTTSAGTYLKELFGGKLLFSAPKNVGLLKVLFSLLDDKNLIVMDFFSGSATTADAVMQLNSIDNGNRRFIMVQVPEKCDENSEAFKEGYKTICDIGLERISRAGKKIKEETNADIDYGFRVYKVDSSNMKDVYYAPTELQQSQLNMFESNVKEDRTAEDLLTQVILDLGLTLDLSIEEKKILNNNVYFVESNSLVACFDDTIDINIIDEICKCKPLKIVFKESSFKTDSDKINTFERIKKMSPEIEVNII